jgi:hypothetical protein
MTIGTVSASSPLAAGYTRQQWIQAVDPAMVALGFTVFDTYSDANYYYSVYRFIHDAGNAFGTSYVRLSIPISGSAVSIRQYTTWNTTNKTGTTATNEINAKGRATTNTNPYTPVSTQPLTFYSVNLGSEARFIIMFWSNSSGGVSSLPVGFFRPSFFADWATEATRPMAYAMDPVFFNQGSQTATHSSSTVTGVFLAPPLAGFSPSGKRDLITGFVVYGWTANSVTGQMGDGMAFAYTSGLAAFDTITTPSGKVYTVVDALWGLCVRTA